MSLAALARLYPVPVDPDAEYRRAVSFLDLPVDPPTLLRAGYGLAVAAAAAVAVPAIFLRSPARRAALLGAVACGLAVAYGAESLPKVLARWRRTRRLGAAPDIVVRAAVQMRLEPAPERAAAFAGGAEGRLADSLADHVRAARHAPGAGSGLPSFAREWGEWFPPLERALALVETAGEAPPADREAVLDRALDAVLDGTRTRTRAYATAVRGPATALYAFGVLLPTALIALVPAAGAAGLAVTPLTIAPLYVVGVPAAVAAGGAWLVARRPVAFPPPRVTTAHPAVEDRTRLALAVGAGVGLAGWGLAGAVAPSWAAPVVASGWGVGAALWLRSRPAAHVHRRVRAAERELGDALSLVGRRIAAGRSPESTLRTVAGELEGPMGDALAAGGLRSRVSGVPLEDALTGDGGPADRLPSRRLRAGLAAVAGTARRGRPAGEALLALADHVEALRNVEARSRADLEEVCGTLRSTGTVFGPLVAGATVALATRLSGGGFPGGPALPWLGAVVGVYVLLLAALLPALSVALARGVDRTLLATALGRALLAAPAVYVIAYLLVAGLA